jgi:glycosyltransferase involved in cell wall biosynthesis
MGQSTNISMPPRFTVVTVSLNSVTTIADTLLSVRQQSYSAIEHIVIDGGSTDGTVDIVRRSSPDILISEPDRGIYDALNKGVARSTGEIIAFLNADDIYAADDVIASVALEFMAHPLDAVLGDVAFVEAENMERITRVYSSRRFQPSRLAWGWMPAHPALFLRKSVFDRYGLFKTDYRIAGDFEFIARVFSKAGISYRYLPRILVKMRTGGISTRGWKSTLLLNKEVLRACRENGIRTNYLKILSKYPAKMVEFLSWGTR